MVVPRIAVFAEARFGWRAIFPAVALLPLLLALPALLAWFRSPHPDERPRAALRGAAAGGDAGAGIPFAQAIRTRQFWLQWASILIIALAYGGAHSHMPAIVRDHGLSPATAATIGVPRFDCSRADERRHAIGTASLWQARQPVYTASIGRWRAYAEFVPELLGFSDD